MASPTKRQALHDTESSQSEDDQVGGVHRARLCLQPDQTLTLGQAVMKKLHIMALWYRKQACGDQEIDRQDLQRAWDKMVLSTGAELEPDVCSTLAVHLQVVIPLATKISNMMFSLGIN